MFPWCQCPVVQRVPFKVGCSQWRSSLELELPTSTPLPGKVDLDGMEPYGTNEGTKQPMPVARCEL